MKYFEVKVQWSSGFEHSYTIAGSEKSKQLEIDRLNTFNHVSNYDITEINESQYKEQQLH
jgi:hypothetical protein